ncbi:Unknown protein [Striga hermonthica]|uniref:Uncharacterized protein n=1 Tax=Striga hermonthica TaxID=68872 RepID=A0A9N7RHM2_STRHE|nr:Unknown protein [Striga hermonthica]
MLLYGVNPIRCSIICSKDKPLARNPPTLITAAQSLAAAALSSAAALVLSAGSIEVSAPAPPDETLSNIPQTLDSVCTPERGCMKRYKIQRPRSRKAEACTGKCVTTCIQGGYGSPGEGPFNIRR